MTCKTFCLVFFVCFFCIINIHMFVRAEDATTVPKPEDTAVATANTNTDDDKQKQERCENFVENLNPSEFAALSLTFKPLCNRYDDLCLDNEKGHKDREQLFNELYHNVVVYHLHRRTKQDDDKKADDASTPPAAAATETKPTTETTVDHHNEEEASSASSDDDSTTQLILGDHNMMDADVAFSFYFVNDLDLQKLDDQLHAMINDNDGWELTKTTLYTKEELACRERAFHKLLLAIHNDERPTGVKVHLVQRHMVEDEINHLQEQLTHLQNFKTELDKQIEDDNKQPQPEEEHHNEATPTPPAVEPAAPTPAVEPAPTPA